MSRPALLDLFCGAGGATEGYRRAGFDVLGVDVRPRPRYRGDDFVQADALEYVRLMGWAFTAIHASPPCQRYSVATPVERRDDHPDLIDAVRDALQATGRPWVIENVRRAPLRGSLMLCGSMFGLNLVRHRYFEASGPWLSPFGPASCHHRRGMVTVTGHSGYRLLGPRPCERVRSSVGEVAMGIDWMSRAELAQAIPPAYTEWIGRQLREVVR